MIFHGSTANVEISRIEGGNTQIQNDVLAVEEPLEIRLDALDELAEASAKRIQKSISITMRTPGDDFDLALGFLVTEGILNPKTPASQQLESVKYCGPAQKHLGHSNIVRVILRDNVKVSWRSLERNFYTTSSCGVCGKASIDALKLKSADELLALRHNEIQIAKSRISSFPRSLREAQKVFNSTGGLHASGIFNTDGELEVLREDVGRHNALDKVIGWAFRQDRLPLEQSILVLSGRISFELVQKAAMAGLPFIIAVGAPSSLALQLAIEARITLVGFVRDGRFNVYHDEGRLV